MARQPESTFAVQVKEFLHNLPKTWFIRYSGILVGVPDYLGCVNGRFIGLELKSSSGAQRSSMQIYIVGKINAIGGYARFVYPENWEEIKQELQRLSDEQSNTNGQEKEI